MFVLGSILGFVAGGALIWFCKEPVTKWYKGAEDFIGDLEEQVRSLKARLK